MLTIMGSEYNADRDALEIYVSGCNRDCPGCHNPEGHAFGKGKSWRLWLKENTWKIKTGTFNRVWILGGDLVGQPVPEAVEFLSSLRRAMPEHMECWLWTGAEVLDAVPDAYLEFFDIVKTGSYKKHLPIVEADVYGDGSEFIVLASNNQRFHYLGADGNVA